MIRVKIEIVPYGDEDLKRDIGELIVYNTGKKSHTGKYIYNYTGKMKRQTGNSTVVTGSVEHFRYNPMEFLLHRVFEDMEE